MTDPTQPKTDGGQILAEAASAFLRDFDLLIASSDGVAGLHRNGDIAVWDDLLPGGYFEDWLASAEGLRTQLAHRDAKGGGGDA